MQLGCGGIVIVKLLALSVYSASGSMVDASESICGTYIGILSPLCNIFIVMFYVMVGLT